MSVATTTITSTVTSTSEESTIYLGASFLIFDVSRYNPRRVAIEIRAYVYELILKMVAGPALLFILCSSLATPFFKMHLLAHVYP